MHGFKRTRDVLRVMHLAASRITAGDPQGYPVLCTQHMPAQALSTCASVLQHSSSCSYVISKAAHMAIMCPNLTSLCSLSCNFLTQPQNSQALFPSHPFTSLAAQRQGISRSAISGSLLSSQAHSSAQADVFHTSAKGWHRQYVSVTPSATMLSGFSTVTKGTSNSRQGGPDISLLSPRLQSLWDHACNAHLGNILVRPYSDLKVHWTCTKCPDGHIHKWKARVSNTSRNRGCPLCSGHTVCPHNSLPRKAPHLVQEWDTAANSDSPHEYTVRSGHRPHWRCRHGHQWQTSIFDRVQGTTGCPVCVKARPRQRLPTLTASTSQVMQFWDSGQNTTAGLDPSKLTCGSNVIAHFTCNQCPKQRPHTWIARVYDIALKGRGCPYCNHHQVCKCNSLATVRPDLAAEWCYEKNDCTPDDVMARSHKKVWWENGKQGQWKGSIDGRSYTAKSEDLEERSGTGGQQHIFPVQNESKESMLSAEASILLSKALQGALYAAMDYLENDADLAAAQTRPGYTPEKDEQLAIANLDYEGKHGLLTLKKDAVYWMKPSETQGGWLLGHDGNGNSGRVLERMVTFV